MLTVRHTINGSPTSASEFIAWKDQHGWDNVTSEAITTAPGQWVVDWRLKEETRCMDCDDLIEDALSMQVRCIPCVVIDVRKRRDVREGQPSGRRYIPVVNED